MPKSLISIHDFSKEEMLHILDVAQEFEKNKSQDFLRGKVVATLFFEPSTRTRLSFATAANRLGARVIGFSDADNTSVSKGETLKDTIKMVSNYVDLIVMRHPLEGSSRYASYQYDIILRIYGISEHIRSSRCILAFRQDLMNDIAFYRYAIEGKTKI